MAFINTTFAKAAFKKSFGKAHTSNDKEMANESIRSFANVRAADLFADPISSVPAESVTNGCALACTGLLALPLVLDPSSDGRSYFVVVPDYHPLKSRVNPLTERLYETGDRVTRVIPDSYGDAYRPTIWRGQAVVAPFALENWVFDPSSGVLTSELPLDLGTTGNIECYVYVGSSLQEYVDRTVAAGSPGSLAYYQTNKTLASKPALRVADSTLVLGERSGLAFNDTHDDFSVSVRASDFMLESYELKWPTSKATEAGQVLAVDTNGQLFFQSPTAVQTGAVGLPVGAKMVSVVYETPFYNAPTAVQAQWSVTSTVEFPAIVPNLFIDRITREGFIARWTHAVPSTGYVLRWQTFVSIDYNPLPLTVYITSSAFDSTVSAYAPDYGTFRLQAANLSSARTSVQSFSSPQASYIAGGRESSNQILDLVQKMTYNNENITTLPTTLSEAKAKGASVGSQTKGYLVGGRANTGASSSILRLDNISESSVVVAVSINGSSEGKGAFNVIDFGYIGLDGLSGDVTKLDINTETLSQVTALGVDDVSCGCNQAGSGLGYFSRNSNSEVLKYQTDLDTVSALTATLRPSTKGQSCAFNNLVSGFFVGSQGIDSLDFSTDTISAVSSDLTANSPGTSNAFQSQGLL